MAQANDMDGILLENLADAGCDDDEARNIFEHIKNNEVPLALSLLTTHKKKLLGEIHDDQHKVDCLDYLVFQLRKGL
ncbi:MAG: hypothetical protein NC428_10635 [Clostridium sp.]|nr:hypothetical protein [Clostridium sp.]MCM1400097.1 hypothetical protein [Clostridium sp.]MCM1459627.1 hypothetical protein [Bacteroides sp.]